MQKILRGQQWNRTMATAEKTHPEVFQRGEEQFFQIIKVAVQMIGYQKVIEVVTKAANEAVESSKAQIWDIEGAFSREVAEIGKRYPGMGIRFVQSESGPLVEILIETKEAKDAGDPMLEGFQKEVAEAFARHRKLKPLSLKMTKSLVPVEVEEGAGEQV